jgi:hypothetical protein
MVIELPNQGGSSGASQPPQGGARIHVDTDWKKQAQAEKERLTREVEAAAAAKAAAPKDSAGVPGAEYGGRAQGLPPATFSVLVQTLATQAAMFMSEQPDPETGAPMRNLELAKHNIDLLRVLEEKTRGNLSEEEKHLLETLLYELLMAYVSAAS